MAKSDDKPPYEPMNQYEEKFFNDLQEKLYKEELIRCHQFRYGSKYNPMNIEPFHFDRERLSGAYTEQDRILRKQYLEDLVMSHNEPVKNINVYPINIFRRIYTKPFQLFFNAIEPIIGKHYSEICRSSIHKIVFFIGCTYYICYKLKFANTDWTHASGGYNLVYNSRPMEFPGSRDPNVLTKHGVDFDDRDFKKRTVLRENIKTSTMISTPKEK